MSPGAQLLPDGPVVERLATGATWSEGPLWMPDERAVRWSVSVADVSSGEDRRGKSLASPSGSLAIRR